MITNVMQFEKKYNCKIIIDHSILSEVNNYLIPLLSGKRAILITNPLVKELYGKQLVSDLSRQDIFIHIIEVPDRETSKSLDVVTEIYNQMLQLKADRSTTLITLGGGVIGDLGGFVAATFMRGIPLIHIPTTLLAQIDSSIGGKVAIDHPLAKNVIGSFYQPLAILTDPTVLQSLPMEQVKNGIVEAIKIAIIHSPLFFHWLEFNVDNLLQKNKEELDTLVKEAIQLKSDIVLRDPWEKFERQYLNLGHSIGHAMEASNHYRSLTHGEAVATGIILETRIAYNKCICTKKEKNKIEIIINKLNFPIKEHLRQFDIDKCWNAILLDKKNKNGIVRFILPEKIGQVHLIQPISKEDVFYALNILLAEGEKII